VFSHISNKVAERICHRLRADSATTSVTCTASLVGRERERGNMPAHFDSKACVCAAFLLFGCDAGSVTTENGGDDADIGSRADASTGGADADPAAPDAAPGRPDAAPGSPDAAPGGLDCTKASTWPAEWVAYEDAVLVIVNQRRAEGGSCGGVAKPPQPALKMDEKLRQAARCHSLDMAQHNYFSHDSQDGRSPWDRISEAGYTAFGNAENIAAGQGDAESVMGSWMDSTGHCNNIMSGGSNEIGIGYAFDQASDFDRLWTQDFGQR
jgi:uncharacterized protein YkwD